MCDYGHGIESNRNFCTCKSNRRVNAILFIALFFSTVSNLLSTIRLVILMNVCSFCCCKLLWRLVRDLCETKTHCKWNRRHHYRLVICVSVDTIVVIWFERKSRPQQPDNQFDCLQPTSFRVYFVRYMAFHSVCMWLPMNILIAEKTIINYCHSHYHEALVQQFVHNWTVT